MLQEIYLIDDSQELKETLKRIFKSDKGYRFTSVSTEKLEIHLTERILKKEAKKVEAAAIKNMRCLLSYKA